MVESTEEATRFSVPPRRNILNSIGYGESEIRASPSLKTPPDRSEASRKKSLTNQPSTDGHLFLL